MIKNKNAAVFMSNYSIGKSSPVICLLELLTDNYSVDLYLFDVRHLNAKVLKKVANIYKYEDKYRNITDIPANHVQKYDFYIALDANGFALCKCIFPDSKPFYYSLELYFKDNTYNLSYPKEIMDLERSEINSISGLFIQSEEREFLFRREYGLDFRIPSFILPVTYMHPSNRKRSDFIRRKLNLTVNQKIALHIGGVQEYHSLVELTAAFMSEKDWVFIIHGNAYGDYKEKLERFIINNNVKNVFLSNDYFEDLDDLDNILMACDVGIAWYNDVSPNFTTAGKSSGKLSAYLRFGLPVIINKYRSTVEGIEKPGCGICVTDFREISGALKKITNNYQYYSANGFKEYDRVYWIENYRKTLIDFIESQSENETKNIKTTYNSKIDDNQFKEFLNPELSIDNIDRFYIRSSIKKAIDENISNFKGVFVDLGCGEMPYKTYLLNNSEIENYIGIDIHNQIYQKNTLPDKFWDGKKIPLDDYSVDTLMATELFEHLPDIQSVLFEIKRVLKPNGFLFFTVPFLWPLHDVPYDEYRYTPFSLERHFKNALLSDIIIKPFGGWNASLAQMIGLWLKRSDLTVELRAHYSEQLFMFYKSLINTDVVPQNFEAGPMVPGFYGSARNGDKENLLFNIDSNLIQGNEPSKSNHIKVIVVVYYFPKLSETFILDQITGLIDLNIDVEIWALAPSNETFVNPSVEKYKLQSKLKYIQLPDSNLTDLDWFAKFEAINNTKITDDYVFHVNFGINFITYQKLFRVIKNPVIVSFLGLDASMYVRQNGINCYKELFERVSLVTTPSYEMQDFLISIGAKKEKMYVLRCGVDTGIFSPQSRKTQNNNSFTFISVARLVEKKGLEYSIRAFSQISTPFNTVYKIIGDGPLESSLKELVKTLGIEDRVLFLGPKPIEEVLDEMLNSDVYVLTSVTSKDGDKEGLPVTLIEAQSIGMPVVSSYHAGIPELIDDGYTGFLCEEGDIDDISMKMQLLAVNKSLRDRMSSNSRKKILKEFDIVQLNTDLANRIIMLHRTYKKNI